MVGGEKVRCEAGKDIALNSIERLQACEIRFYFGASGAPGHSFHDLVGEGANSA